MIHTYEGCALASVGSCMLSAWRGRVTASNMALHRKLASELENIYPEGFTMMVIINSSVSLPDSTERAILGGYYRTHGPQLRGVANVILGEGFFASATRALLPALLACSPKPYPMKIFASTSSAALWLRPLTVQLHPDDPDFLETLHELADFLGAPVSFRPPRRSRPRE